jgi:hypothetical protein
MSFALARRPVSMVDSTKTASPQTMGVELRRPGSAVFHFR